MPVITVDRLSAYYENRAVFSDLSFKVNDGDYLCIVGENGSGKTTLMHCILGFNVKHTGSVMFDSISRREIGWLPQRTDTQKDFPASVKEVVYSGFAGGHFSLEGKMVGNVRRERCSSFFEHRRHMRETAEKNMRMLEIYDLKNRTFRELSGGQQQRVLLCRALCAANRVLLLDEPVTGLDSASRDELYRIIRRLNDGGMTVIMITHDLPRALDEAKSVLYLGEGSALFTTAQEYKNSLFDGGAV